MTYTKTCLCCGAPWDASGCVVGYDCECDQSLYGLCLRCGKCTVHCQCEQGPATRIETINAERWQEEQAA